MNFGRFDIDLGMRCLRLDGQTVRLGSRAFDLLVAIVTADGRLVTRNELMEAVWPGIIVEESNIDVHISALRKALGADRDLIVTVARRGYRFAQPQLTSSTTATTQISALPSRRPVLTGRDAALSQLRDALSQATVLTLTGTGGVGKTSLAMEVAEQTNSGLDRSFSFVELAQVNSKEGALKAIAESCALPVDSKELTVASLAQALSETPRFLLLDSAEHIVGSVAEIVESLLAKNHALRMLVTSREPLRIRSERVFKVEPLETPHAHATAADILQSPAVELFVQRATSLPADVGADSREIQMIGEICRRLDGIPLAIELAAARVEALGVEGVRRRLDDRLTILTGGYRTATPRHRTLRATFDASFALLSETAQCLFQRVSIFNGPFTFESMRAVVCDAELTEDDAIDAIGELVAKSLVNVAFEGSEATYRLFESTRVYATDRFQEQAGNWLDVPRYSRAATHSGGRFSAHHSADEASVHLKVAA